MICKEDVAAFLVYHMTVQPLAYNVLLLAFEDNLNGGMPTLQHCFCYTMCVQHLHKAERTLGLR